jgi:pilus assembly protein Flp/PilA
MLQAIVSYLETLRAREERGQGMVEYALILALVSIVAIVILVLLGPQISSMLSQVTSALKN